MLYSWLRNVYLRAKKGRKEDETFCGDARVGRGHPARTCTQMKWNLCISGSTVPSESSADYEPARSRSFTAVDKAQRTLLLLRTTNVRTNTATWPGGALTFPSGNYPVDRIFRFTVYPSGHGHDCTSLRRLPTTAAPLFPLNLATCIRLHPSRIRTVTDVHRVRPRLSEPIGVETSSDRSLFG